MVLSSNPNSDLQVSWIPWFSCRGFDTHLSLALLEHGGTKLSLHLFQSPRTIAATLLKTCWETSSLSWSQSLKQTIQILKRVSHQSYSSRTEQTSAKLKSRKSQTEKNMCQKMQRRRPGIKTAQEIVSVGDSNPCQ